MENVKSLGDLFLAEDVPEFAPAIPSSFNPELSRMLLEKSNARRRSEQTFNSARNYRKLFTRLTGKALDIETEEKFSILEEQFGKLAILEAIEYMAFKNSSWELAAFNTYLLKVLQGNRRQQEEITHKNPEDIQLEILDRTTNRKMMRHNGEIRRWERETKRE